VYGIAKNLIKEQMREGGKLSSLDYLREKVGFEPAQRKPEDPNRERPYNITRNVALRDCLARIEEPNRSYFLVYISECDEGSREDMRRELAKRAGITSEALRTRMHGVRTRLKNCLNHVNLHQRKPRDRDRMPVERRKVERAEQNSDES
jgi:DNA-directed RNA polymerase specialized sigma24 family protein